MMITLNDGKFELLKKVITKTSKGTPLETLEVINSYWFSFLNIFNSEYYGARNANVKISLKIRTSRNEKITSENIICLREKNYKIGNVTHTLNKNGFPVTDVVLEANQF